MLEKYEFLQNVQIRKHPIFELAKKNLWFFHLVLAWANHMFYIWRLQNLGSHFLSAQKSQKRTNSLFASSEIQCFLIWTICKNLYFSSIFLLVSYLYESNGGDLPFWADCKKRARAFLLQSFSFNETYVFYILRLQKLALCFL